MNDVSQRPPVRCPTCLSTETAHLRSYRATLPVGAKIFSGLSINTCRTCSASFAYPCPPESVLATYYATDYRAEDDVFRLTSEPGPWSGPSVRARSQIEFVRTRDKASNRQKMTSWLDLGAGYGCLLDEVKKHGAVRTGAVEHDEECRRRLRSNGHEIYDAMNNIGSGWDVISFSHLLEHLSEPRKFLEQIKELVSDKAYVFCEVPNDIRIEEAKNDAPHLIFFTARSLSSLFRTAGYEVLAVETCGARVQGKASPGFESLLRRVAIRLFHSPPAWLDRFVHRHFHYSKKDDRSWIRLLARRLPAALLNSNRLLTFSLPLAFSI